MAKLLDENGLAYFWGKVKAAIPTKTSQLTNDSSYITADSPALTGVPTAPTAAVGDSSTQIATTAFVQTAIASNVLVSIEIVSPPTKTEYNKDEALVLDGLVIKATYETGNTEIVTDYTTDPINGTALTGDGEGSQVITVSYTKHSVTKTASFTVEVGLKLVTWAGGTDKQIVAMVAAADAGEINLADYWAVGDVRSVNLSAMSATSVKESHEAQTVEFVLMDTTCQGFTITATGKKPSFIVGMKNCLNETGYMNSYNTNSDGWSGCARRTWCNNVFYNAVPSTLRNIFKQFTWQQSKGGGTAKLLLTTQDYFGLAPEKAVFGSNTYSLGNEAALYSQWAWYKTGENRSKTANGSGCFWWECSPKASDTKIFCSVHEYGSASQYEASSTLGLAPFGCI